MGIIIAWHEKTSTYWANCPDWKELMTTEGYTIGEATIPDGTNEIMLKKYMKEEGYHRIMGHELKDFIENLNEQDAQLLQS